MSCTSTDLPLQALVLFTCYCYLVLASGTGVCTSTPVGGPQYWVALQLPVLPGGPARALALLTALVLLRGRAGGG